MKTASFFLKAVLGLALVAGFGITTTPAQVSTRVSTRQVQRLLTRIETKIEVLKDEAERVSTRSGRQNQQNQDVNDAGDLARYLDELNASVSRLDDAFDGRQMTDAELREAMSDATVVDQFMNQNRVSVAAQAQWRSLKRDFNTLATYNRLSWNWNQTIPTNPTGGGFPTGSRPYVVTDAQMQTLLSRIELKTNILKERLTKSVAETRNDSFRNTPSISNYVAGFETAVDRLKAQFDARQSTDRDVTDVLTRAAYIDQYVSRNNLPVDVEGQWRNLRGDLNTLASNYQVSWNWNQTLPPYPGDGSSGPITGRGFDAAITGTFRLNTSLSEDVSTAVDRALGQSTNDQQRNRLEQRLRSPEMIAIEKSNATVTMASSNLQRVTFQADGVARSETNQNGRRTTTTATADADGLIINYQGERANDFYVTFLPTADGRLKVTRRVYLENSNTAVTVSSVYDKVDQVARWNQVSTGVDNSAGVVNDSFIVPTGTRMTAVLRTPIDLSTSLATDRISLEVTTPTQYRGAVINGRVITEDPSTQVAGRSRVLVSFDSIRMTNGQSYRFSGLVNGVISADGGNISVTQQTPVRQSTRGNVGDILGALIGAISGRPITQTTAGTTSGSIIAASGGQLVLRTGSEFVITAASDATTNQ